MKRVLFLIGVFVLGLQIAMAQMTVSGTVTDTDTKEPLEGVAVLIKGTTIGMFTNSEGKYELEVPSDGAVLLFTFVGKQTVEEPINGRTSIDIEMGEDPLLLSEVIISGQGVGIEKRRLSTTLEVITSEDIEKTPLTQLDQVLQSKLPTAQIQLSSGQPGTASIIRARGPVSAARGTTPVIYIDGVRVDNLNGNPEVNQGTGGAASSVLADLPIENIERIEFLKGGAATTLYGSDAANGVLQIFTKTGKSGRPRVNAQVQLGSIVGTTDFLRFEETADLIFEPGLLQSYRMGIEGGNEGVSYSFTGSGYHDDGFNTVNEQERYSFRNTLSANLTKDLKFTSSNGYSQLAYTRDYNANTSRARFANAESGDFGVLDTLNQDAFNSVKELVNLQGELTNIVDRVRRFTTANSLTWNISPKFVAQVGFGVDFRKNTYTEVSTNALLVAQGSVSPGTNDQGFIAVAEREFLSSTGNFNFVYTEEVGNFSFITTLGGQYFRTSDDQLGYSGSDVAEGSLTIGNAAERNFDADAPFNEALTNGGIYVAENIGIKDRFFIELGVRVDANSAFGEDIGPQAFPKVGISYNISEEDWFVNAIPTTAISYAKIRANYGEAGLFPQPFSRDRLLVVNPFNGNKALTFGNPGNLNLGPERTRTIEAGLDLGALNGLISLEFTYYNATTVDAIFSPPQAPSTGQLAQDFNIGEINNEGIESALTIRPIKTADVDLSFTVSLNTNQNIVTSNGGTPEFVVGGFTFLGSFIKDSLPLGYFRGANPVFDETGALVDVERNANLGTPWATTFGTFAINFRYKKLSAFINSSYQMGAQGVNVDDVLRYFNDLGTGEIVNSTNVPEAAFGSSFFDIAGVWVENTDFFKIRTISLSYDFGSLANNAIKGLRVGFNAQNPFNFVTSNFDPEVTGANIGEQGRFSAGGFGFGTESPPRMFIGSVNISL